MPLLQLNVESYVAALEAKGEELSLTEVRAEIKRASADLESLMESVPIGISLGLVQINLVKVGARAAAGVLTAACTQVWCSPMRGVCVHAVLVGAG